MPNTSDIISLLVTQKDTFLRVEEITDLLLSAPSQELPELVSARGKLIESAIKTEEELHAAACGDENLLEVLSCSCSISELSEELTEVFEAALRVRATVNRISKMETGVLDRVRSERDMALEKIEALNKSGNSVAAKYKQAVRTAFPQSYMQGRTMKV